MFGTHLSRLGSVHRFGLVPRALAILRSYGADAHVYLPGIGTVSGLTAGNYLDSAGTTAATIDNPVGLVVDPLGAVNATQATTANKPILRRGLLNQLLWSNDLTNAIWTKDLSGDGSAPIVTPNYAVSPDGSTNATRVQFSRAGGFGFSRLIQIASTTTPTTQVWYLKTTDSSTKTIGLRNGASAQSNISVDGTWRLFVLNVPTGDTEFSMLTWSGMAGTDLNVDLLIYRAGLFRGTYTAQQIIDAGGIPLTTSAAASNPGAGKYSWQFDGSNDSLLTGNLGITNTVSVVIAGVLNSLPTTTVFANEGVNGLQILIRNTGVIDCLKAGVEPIISAASGTIVAGVPFVLTFRLQGGVSVLRKNGAQVSTAAYVASLSATAGLSIGAASASIDGSIYSIDVITATTTDSDLLTLERLAAQMAGVSI